jgi:nucleotide-binding universal stress UspA family protein
MPRTPHTPADAHGTLNLPDRRAVVVGIESSDDNAVVIEWAAGEARARGAPLRLVHTWEWDNVPIWATPYHFARKKDLEREAARILEHARKCAVGAGACDVRIVTRRGYAADVLLDMTADASLLVVGGRHASALARGVFGSVSAAVVSEATCPVVVLSGPPGMTDERAEVVVGVAGGPHDHRVLAFAFDFAREHGLPLRAVLCWDAMFGNIALPPPDATRLRLAESLAGWADRFPDVQTHLAVERGDPADILVQTAASQALLVVGRHAPRLRFGAILGSTTLGVVHHATCPVAVIPPVVAVQERQPVAAMSSGIVTA